LSHAGRFWSAVLSREASLRKPLLRRASVQRRGALGSERRKVRATQREITQETVEHELYSEGFHFPDEWPGGRGDGCLGARDGGLRQGEPNVSGHGETPGRHPL